MDRPFRFLLAWIFVTVATTPSCTRSKLAETYQPPKPTMEEVFVLGGRPLSLSGFEALCEELKGPPSGATFVRGADPIDSCLWVAQAIYVLQAKAAGLSPVEGLLLARYSLGQPVAASGVLNRFKASLPPATAPGEFRKGIDELIAQTKAARGFALNEALVAELRATMRW